MAQQELQPTAKFEGTVREIRDIPSGLKETVVAVIETHNNPNLPKGASPIAWYPVDRSILPGMSVDIAQFEQKVGNKGGVHVSFEVSPKG